MVSAFTSTQPRVKSGFHSENPEKKKKIPHLCSVEEIEQDKQFHQLLLVCSFLSTVWPSSLPPQNTKVQRKLIYHLPPLLRILILSIHKIISYLLLCNMQI